MGFGWDPARIPIPLRGFSQRPTLDAHVHEFVPERRIRKTNNSDTAKQQKPRSHKQQNHTAANLINHKPQNLNVRFPEFEVSEFPLSRSPGNYRGIAVKICGLKAPAAKTADSKCGALRLIQVFRGIPPHAGLGLHQSGGVSRTPAGYNLWATAHSGANGGKVLGPPEACLRG